MKKTKKIVSIVLAVLMVASMVVALPVITSAYSVPSESQFSSKLDQLRIKYPNGGTWSGTYYENGTGKAWTCFGYAAQMMYEVFGAQFYNDGFYNKKDYSMGTLYAGDFVRLDAGYGPDTHSIFITKVTNDRFYFTDGNFDNKNGIRWDASYSKTDMAKRFTYKVHIPGNTLTGNGHTHNYSTLSGYESAHPHYAIYKCSCGATQVNKSKTKYNKDCASCRSSLGAKQTISDGDYLIASALDLGSCINVAGGNSKESGMNVHLWHNTGSANIGALVTVKHLGSGVYSLIFRNSGMAMDVQGGGTESGTNVQQYTPNQSMAQEWVIKEAGDDYYFYIISRVNGLCLDANGGSSADGTNIQVYTGNGSKAQKWRFFRTGYFTGKSVEEGRYRITSKLDDNLSLDIADKSGANMASVQVYNRTRENRDTFDLEYLGDGLYTITYAGKNRRLDVTNNIPYNKAAVQIYDANTSNAQKWVLQPTGDGYYNIVSNSSGLYLDISGGGKADGTKVQMYLGNGTDAQKWKLEKVEKLNFSYIVCDDGTAQLGNYLGSDTDVIIPSKIDGYDISTIVYAFVKKYDLKHVTIPNTIKEIGPYAFIYCSSLNNVEIPNSITELGYGAFAYCRSLTDIVIPDSVSNIGTGVFYECVSLKNVTIGSGVKSIKDSAFYNCENLKSVVIPNNVEEIGKEAFGYTENNGKVEGFTIKGYKNSAAEKYAEENGFKFIDLENEEPSENPTEAVTEPVTEPTTEKPTEPEPEPDEPTIKAQSVAGKAGKTVEVPVVISKNPGITALTLNVSYDTSALKLTGVKDGEILGENIHKPEYTSPYTLSWANDNAKENFTSNGTLATLTFEIKDTAKAGKYPITLSYDFDNYGAYNKDAQKVKLTIKNGAIEVTDFVYGDVNGDDLDRLYLTRHLANWADYKTIDENAADVDGNGTVNNLDRLILTRHLANWSDYKELPYKN